MARKPNYGYERNARAKAKAEKREAKRQAKLNAKAAKQAENSPAEPDEDAAPSDAVPAADETAQPLTD